MPRCPISACIVNAPNNNQRAKNIILDLSRVNVTGRAMPRSITAPPIVRGPRWWRGSARVWSDDSCLLVQLVGCGSILAIDAALVATVAVEGGMSVRGDD